MSITYQDFQVAPTSATAFVDVTAVVGDLIEFLVCNNDPDPCTASFGLTTGVTASAADNGVTASDGTRRSRIFSYIVKSTDIGVGGAASGKVRCTASAHTLGGSRRVMAYVKRSTIGFDDNRLVASGEVRTATGAPPNVLTETATLRDASGVVASNFASNQNTSVSWDGGTARVSDYPGGAGQSLGHSKPNVAGTEPAYPADPSRTQEQISITGMTAGVARAIAFAVFQEKVALKPNGRFANVSTMRYAPKTIVTQYFSGKIGNASTAQGQTFTTSVPFVTVKPPPQKFSTAGAMHVHVRPPPDYISPGKISSAAILIAVPTTRINTTVTRHFFGKTSSTTVMRARIFTNVVLPVQVSAGANRMSSVTTMRFNADGETPTPVETFELSLGLRL